VWYDFQGESETFFSSAAGPVKISSKLGGPWFQGDLGVTAQITDVLSLYGTFGGNVYLNGRGQAYNAVAGLRANF
jgi:outer membrane autotransporter protein